MQSVPLPADAVEIRSHLELLTEGKRGVELRAVGGLLPVRQVGAAARKRGTEAGFFTDLDEAARAAQRCSDEGFGAVYVTLNEVDPTVFARGEGKMVRGGQATQDQDVRRYRNLLLDFDPVRPSGISSTEEELRLAMSRAARVCEELAALGWDAPLYWAESGNGHHVVYRVSLEQSERNRKLVREVLRAVSGFWSDDRVEVDASVHNPARVTKVVGTVTRKGDDAADRPHRRASFMRAVPDAKPVPAKTLRALVAKWDEAQGRRGKPKTLAEGSEVDDLWRAMEAAGLEPQPAKERDYGTTIASKCWKRPGDNAGGSHPAFVVVSGDRQLRAGCRHATCDADVASLLAESGLRQSHPVAGSAGGDGAALFAASPEDDVAEKVNALGVAIVFSDTGRSFLVTPPDGRGATRRLKPDDVRDYVGSRVEYVESERGLVHPLTVWLRSPRRREAFGTCYDDALPYGGISEHDEVNLWRGYAYEPGTSRTGAKLFRAWREHLRKHVAAGREREDAYLWDLFCWKLQHPTWLPMVLPVLIGKPGDGKGVGVLPIVNLLGQHGLHTESPMLGARFNDRLEGRAVVFHDEADHLADPRVMRAMKARVTEGTGTFEAKGHSIYQAPNFALHVAATNHPRVRVDAHDRRLLVLETAGPRDGIEWFERKGIRQLVARHHLREADSVAFHRQVLHEALAADLGTFRPNPPPMTRERDQQILESPELTVLQSYLMTLLETGELRGIPGGNSRWRGTRTLFANERNALHGAYIAWAEHALGPERFRSGFPGHTFSGFSKGVLSLLGVVSGQKKVSGRNVRTWRFPALEEARRRFEEGIGLGDARSWRDFDEGGTE